MFTYKEALDENQRMIEFREKHLYNSKSHNEDTPDDSTDYPEKINTYNFYN